MGACHGGGGRVRLAELAVLLAVGLYVVLLIHPISLVLPKETGWSPKEKRFLGWWRPREVSGPTRLSHSRGSCHSAAKVSASRTDLITRPMGEGLGPDVDWRLKVFCPAFLQKSGRGPGAEPWPRAAARGIPPCSMKRRRGSKGEPSPGVPPLRAALPPAARAIYGDPQSSGAGRGWNPAPTRGWRNVVGSAVAEGKGRRGRRPLRRVGDGPCAA